MNYAPAEEEARRWPLAWNFRFEPGERKALGKLESSNLKEVGCSRIIAWSVNDLSPLLRPEKERKDRAG